MLTLLARTTKVPRRNQENIDDRGHDQNHEAQSPQLPLKGSSGTAAFFERHLGFMIAAKIRTEAWILKRPGFDVVVENADYSHEWPKNFHIGFELPTIEGVRDLYERFKADGVENGDRNLQQRSRLPLLLPGTRRRDVRVEYPRRCSRAISRYFRQLGTFLYDTKSGAHADSGAGLNGNRDQPPYASDHHRRRRAGRFFGQPSGAMGEGLRSPERGWISGQVVKVKF